MRNNNISFIKNQINHKKLFFILALMLCFTVIFSFGYKLAKGGSTLYVDGGGGENTTDWSNVNWDSPAVQETVYYLQNDLMTPDEAVNIINEIAQEPELETKKVKEIKQIIEEEETVKETNTVTIVNGETFVKDPNTGEWKLQNQTVEDAIKALSGETSAFGSITLDDGTVVKREIGPDGKTIIGVYQTEAGPFHYYDTNGNLLDQNFNIIKKGDYAGLTSDGYFIESLDQNNGVLNIQIKQNLSDPSIKNLNLKGGESASTIPIDGQNGLIVVHRADGSTEYYSYGTKFSSGDNLIIQEAQYTGIGFNDGAMIVASDATGLGIQQGLITANLFITKTQTEAPEIPENFIEEFNYSCNASTWTCYQDPNGSYYSFTTCQNNCKPTNKYSCNIATLQCYPDANGIYSSLTTCQNNCKFSPTEALINLNANKREVTINEPVIFIAQGTNLKSDILNWKIEDKSVASRICNYASRWFQNDWLVKCSRQGSIDSNSTLYHSFQQIHDSLQKILQTNNVCSDGKICYLCGNQCMKVAPADIKNLKCPDVFLPNASCVCENNSCVLKSGTMMFNSIINKLTDLFKILFAQVKTKSALADVCTTQYIKGVRIRVCADDYETRDEILQGLQDAANDPSWKIMQDYYDNLDPGTYKQGNGENAAGDYWSIYVVKPQVRIRNTTTTTINTPTTTKSTSTTLIPGNFVYSLLSYQWNQAGTYKVTITGQDLNGNSLSSEVTIIVRDTLPKYSCNPATGQCYEDLNGTYSDLSTCNSLCEATPVCTIEMRGEPSTIILGKTFNLVWSVSNDCNKDTCVASIIPLTPSNTDGGNWSGNPYDNPATTVNTPFGWNTTVIKPTVADTYTYQLTCDGNTAETVNGVYDIDIKVIKLPIWREIIPNLSGFLKGLFR